MAASNVVEIRCYADTPEGRTGLVTVVTGDGSEAPLKRSKAAQAKSPNGWGWGYCGAGPAGLASSILEAVIGKEAGADNRHYQNFKERYVAHFNVKSWSISAGTVKTWWTQNR